MNDLEKYIKENEPVYFSDVEGLLKAYIKGPVDKQGKSFTCGCEVHVPWHIDIKNLKGCYYSFETEKWYIEGSSLRDCSVCTIIAPDTLEKIKEDAGLNHFTYSQKHGFPSPIGHEKMVLDIIKRTEEVVRNELQKG